jgi:hypothetical protein
MTELRCGDALEWDFGLGGRRGERGGGVDGEKKSERDN